MECGLSLINHHDIQLQVNDQIECYVEKEAEPFKFDTKPGLKSKF